MGILDVQAHESDGMTILGDNKTPERYEASEVNIASAICGLIEERFNTAKTARLVHEERWMRAWRNFRGTYGPDVRFTEMEKSSVFIKISKNKTFAAINQVFDILFSTGKFPLTVEPTPVPEGIAETVNITPSQGEEVDIESPYGFLGDEKEWRPGTTLPDLLGPAMAAKVTGKGMTVRPGPGVDETSITLEPAQIAARKMEKTILDQLEESDAIIHTGHTIFEQAALGTGIIEGPFTTTKTYHKWERNPEVGNAEGQEDDAPAMVYNPVIKRVPKISYCSIWSVYPDPEAVNASECNYIIKIRPLTAHKLRSLKDRPGFRAAVIDYILENFNPDYTPEWFEQELKDTATETTTTRYSVKEYWGLLDTQTIEDFGIEIPKALVDKKEVQVNAWICCNQVIRLILNPLTPARIPFYFIPYEKHPYQIWGVGVIENMEDSQMIMNGHARMAIDNLALSGNAVFEIDETYLVNGDDMRLYPGRVFRRQGGPPGQSVFMLQFPNTTQENLAMFDKFRQLADEATGIPSYSHGQTGVTGMTRTSSGMSMLMSASTLNIKGVIRNIDNYLIKPLGEALFSWNMQFNPDTDIRGDLEIRARGTSSLMLKEVRSQRLLMLMQVAANPAWAPFVKAQFVLKELAKDLDFVPEHFINNLEEAKLQALLIRAYTNAAGQGASSGLGTASDSLNGQGSEGSIPGGAGGLSPTDYKGSGGGTIGAGTPALPGEANFSGRPQ